MPRSPLNHALLAVAVGLTFLAFLGTLCNTTNTNYFTNPVYPTLETAFPSFQLRMTPALLFGCQRPPSAPNIALQINPQPCLSFASLKMSTQVLSAVTTQQKGFCATLHQNLQDKELPHIHWHCGSVQIKFSPEIDQDSTWTTLMSSNIMTTRSRLGNKGLKQIEELRLLNKKKNDEIRKQQEE